MNDHAYFLEARKEWEKQLNLQWFVHQCQPMFWQTVSSRSDNATFNKAWLSKMTVDLPPKPTQDAIANRVTRLRHLIERSNRLERSIDSLLSLPIE